MLAGPRTRLSLLVALDQVQLLAEVELPGQVLLTPAPRGEVAPRMGVGPARWKQVEVPAMKGKIVERTKTLAKSTFNPCAGPPIALECGR
jgi:hypothetical protein